MTVTIRHGNLGSATTDVTAKVRAPGGAAVPWALTEAAEKGAPALSGFNLEDPAAAVTLIGLKEVHFEDSGSIDPTLFAGFFDTRNVSRAQTRGLITDVQREWAAGVTDLNVLLADHIIQSGVRPAETDIARIDWLLASGYLPIGDAGFIDRADTTALPAADYTGRTPADVLAECSNLSGQNYFVRWEQNATFQDCASPWASWSSTYTAPYFDGTWHKSSLDLVGGQYDGEALPYFPPGPPPTAGVSGPNDGVALDSSHASGSSTGIIASIVPGSSTTVWWIDLGSAKQVGEVAVLAWNDGMGFFFHPATVSVDVVASNDAASWVVVVPYATISSGGTIHTGTYVGATACGTTPYRYWGVKVYAAWTGDVSYGQSLMAFLVWGGSLGGPGPCLGYHAYNWASDVSTLAISNIRSEQDGVTTFGPAPGDKLSRNPARVYSGVWFEYNGGHVFVQNGTTASTFRTRETRSSDMNCTTAAAATALATAYLTRCATEEDRFTANLHDVPATRVNGMRPGQRIGLKLTHEPGYTSGAYMGIMRRTLTPLGADLYDVLLELAVPVLTGFKPTASGILPSLWSLNIGQVVSPAPTPTTAIVGQRIPPTFIANGDGATVLFTLPRAYQPNSLMVYVDHQLIPYASITETNPGAGTFTLDFAPLGASGSYAVQALHVSWQAA